MNNNTPNSMEHPSPSGDEQKSKATVCHQPSEETTTETEVSEQRIVLLESKLAQFEQQLRDLQLRHLAEQQNVQRRAEQDVIRAHKFSLEKFIRELLPVVDSFERALALADKQNAQLLPMVEGIEMTLKNLHDMLRKFGIEVVEEKSVTFNPEVHQAMQMVDTSEVEENHVIEILQKGYTLHGRLLRPAMVTVSRVQSSVPDQ